MMAKTTAALKKESQTCVDREDMQHIWFTSFEDLRPVIPNSSTSSGIHTLVNRHVVNESPKNRSVSQDQMSVSCSSRQTSRETLNSFTSLSGQSLLLSEQDCSYSCVLRPTGSLFSERVSPRRSHQQLTISASEGNSKLHKTEGISSQMFNSKESAKISYMTEESNLLNDSSSKLLISGKLSARKYSDCTSISSRSSNSPIKVNGASYSRHCQLMGKNTILSKHLNEEAIRRNVSPTLRNINNRIGFGDEHKPARDAKDLKLRHKDSKLNALLTYKHICQEELKINETRDECSGFQIIASHPKVTDHSVSVIPEGKETSTLDIDERLEVKSDKGVGLNMANLDNENKYLEVTNISKKSYMYSPKNYNNSTGTLMYSNQSLRLREESSVSTNVHQSSTCSVLRDRKLKDDTSLNKIISARYSDVKQKRSERNTSQQSMYLKKDCVTTDSHSKETDIISNKRSKVCADKGVEATSDQDRRIPQILTNIERKDRRSYRKSGRKHSEENILSSVDSINCSAYSVSGDSCRYSQCGDKGDALSYSIESNHKHRATDVGRNWKADRALRYRRRSSSFESSNSSSDTVNLEHYDNSIQNLQICELQRLSKMSRDTSVSSSRNRNTEDSYTRLSGKRGTELRVNHTRISRNVSVKKFIGKSIGKISRHSSIHNGTCTSIKSLRVERSHDKQIETKSNIDHLCIHFSGNSLLSKESDAYSKYRTCSENSGYSSPNRSKKAYSKHSDITNIVRRLSKERGEKQYSHSHRPQTDSVLENIIKTSPKTRKSVCCVTDMGEGIIDINKNEKTEIKPQDSKRSASFKNLARVAKQGSEENHSDCVGQYGHRNNNERLKHNLKPLSFLENRKDLVNSTIPIDYLTDNAITKDTASREQSTTSIKGTMLVESTRYESNALINNSDLNVKSISSKCNGTEGKITTHVMSDVDDSVHKIIQDICNLKGDLQDAALSSLSSTSTVTGEQKSTQVLNTHVLSLIQSESPLGTPRNMSEGHHAHVRTSLRSINKATLEAYRNQGSTRKSNLSLRSRTTISLSSASKVADFISSKGGGTSRRYDYSSSNEDSDELNGNTKRTRLRKLSKSVQRRGVSPTKTRYESQMKRCTNTRHISYETSLIQTTNTECSIRNMPERSYVKMQDTPLHERRTSRHYRRTRSKNAQYHCKTKSLHHSKRKSRYLSNSPGGSFERFVSSKHVRHTNRIHQPVSGWSLKDTVQSWAKKVMDSTTWLKTGGSGKEEVDMKKSTSKFNDFSETSDCNDAYLKRRHKYYPRVKCSFESIGSQWSNQSDGDFNFKNPVRKGKHPLKGAANKLRRANSKIKHSTDDDDVYLRRSLFMPNEMRESQTKIKEINKFYARKDKKENSVKSEDFTKNDNLTLSERVDTFTRIGGGIKEKKWAITQINIFNDGSKTYAIGQQSTKSPLKGAVKNVTRVFVTVPLPNGTTKDSTY